MKLEMLESAGYHWRAAPWESNLHGSFGTVSVDVTSGTPAVATITATLPVFDGNDFTHSRAFHLLTAGASVISITIRRPGSQAFCVAGTRGCN